MKLIKYIALSVALLLILFLVFGCSPDLSVTNQNAPDKARALANPNDVEKLAGGSFKEFWWSQTQYYGPPWSLSTMADEFSSSWGNSGMRDLSSEPRKAWDNSSSYGYRYVNRNAWRYCYKAISNASDALGQINAGLTITDADGNDQTTRLKAWCKFIQGISLGFLGQYFDKAFIIDETVDLEAGTPPTASYMQVHEAGMQKLAECIQLCDNNSFDIPEEWWPGNNFSNVDLAKLAHSFIARYEAGVARDPAERAARDWASIASHAAQGITEDFGSDNDGENWWSYLHGLFSNNTWCRTDYKLIGPADTSGAYKGWLDSPVADRNYIEIHTNDARVTGGTWDSDGKYFRYYGNCAFRANRGTYHFSYYHSYKYIDYYKNGYVGWAHIMSAAEMDFLRAEAALRQNDAPTAVDLINKYHVGVGEMAPVTTAIPIGNPGDLRDARPDIGDFGNSLWAVMKYEKGVEIAHKNCGVAWTDRRGWGTLVSGTPIHFPIPGEELDVLQMDNYTFGGVGGEGAAPKMLAPMPPKMDMIKY